jgi:hypothetical protein
VIPGSLTVEDLGYFNQSRLAERQQAGAYSLTRLQAGTALYTRTGQRLCIQDVLPRQVGQMKELRVPKEVADKRREDLLRDAQRRQQTISEETLQLADWTMLVTDVPAKRLRFQEALVLLRERGPMEIV